MIPSLKHALRSMKNQKLYSFVSIFGLSVGMACFFMIFAYVRHEKSYDRFFQDADRIYRVLQNEKLSTSFPLAGALTEYLPDSTILTRIERHAGGLFVFEDKSKQEVENWQVDDQFFNVFDFEFLQGNPRTALSQPDGIVLTESLAQFFFGDQDPLGKIIKTNNSEERHVTGVLKDLPTNCHMQFDALTTWPSYYSEISHWSYFGPQIYIKAMNNLTPAELEVPLAALIKDQQKDQCKTLGLQPITDIHLHSTAEDEYAPVLPHTYIYLFSAVAVLILLVSCINIINITTAQRLQKQEQVGVRKIFCANKSQIMRQFLLESFITTATSFVFAILLMQLLNPLLKNIIRIDYQAQLWSSPAFYLYAILILVLTTLLSGFYPAWLAARTEPLVIFGKGARPKQKFILRTMLIAAQFVIAIGLLATVSVMRSQLHFLHNKNLGFRQDNIFVINTPNSSFNHDDYRAMKNELVRLPNVMAVSHGATPNIAGGRINLTIYSPDGSGDQLDFKQIFAGYDFLQTMGFELVEGRFFSPDFATDKEATIITESAVKALGLENPLGHRFPKDGFPESKEIIGVVKDFNYFSLHEIQRPTFIELMPEEERVLSLVVKLDGRADFDAIKEITKIWKSLVLAWPLDGYFLDSFIDNFYRFEVRLERLFFILTVLAIFLCCLGLFGITAIATQQRTKEIGVRIVHGASVLHVVSLFTRRITLAVAVALAIAAPIVWHLMNKWLQNFAYQIKMPWWLFLLAGLAALVIALLTVSWQAIRAATANPIESLRYE